MVTCFQVYPAVISIIINKFFIYSQLPFSFWLCVGRPSSAAARGRSRNAAGKTGGGHGIAGGSASCGDFVEYKSSLKLSTATAEKPK